MTALRAFNAASDRLCRTMDATFARHPVLHAAASFGVLLAAGAVGITLFIAGA